MCPGTSILARQASEAGQSLLARREGSRCVRSSVRGVPEQEVRVVPVNVITYIPSREVRAPTNDALHLIGACKGADTHDGHVVEAFNIRCRDRSLYIFFLSR